MELSLTGGARSVRPVLFTLMSGESELRVADVAQTVAGFAAALRRDESRLNSLNVFPVADNDTGTNMVRSVHAVVDAISAIGDELDSASLIGAIGTAALDGRGNSGLIVGQFLVGFVTTFSHERLELAPALLDAASLARKAVARPVEGTMLTLADAVAAAAALDTDPAVLFMAANEAVARTPSQLEALGGSIDSGAAGLALFFEALVELDGGSRSEPHGQLIECKVGLESPGAPPPGEIVGHEIQFRVPASVADAETVRALLATIGSDVVVAASADEVAAHLHVVDANVAVNAISADLEGRRGAKAISYDVEPLVEGWPS